MPSFPVADMTGRASKANIVAVMGATGTGKTSLVMAEVKRAKPRRLLVWDSKQEFAAEGYGQPVRSLVQLVQILVNARDGRKPFKICYIPRGDGNAKKKQFDIFCRAAFEAGGITMICEELSEVTTPTLAPYGWQKATSQGRARGLTIYGLSQTPAQIDKAFFGNSTRVVCFRLNFSSHVKAMADCLAVSDDDVRSLINGSYIERDMTVGTLNRGRVF